MRVWQPQGIQSAVNPVTSEPHVTPVIIFIVTDRIKLYRICVKKTGLFHTTFGLYKKVT